LYNVRAYELWGLRDDKTSIGDPYMALGLLRDDCSIPAAGFECKLDRDRWRECGSTQRFGGLAPGEHRLQVRAIGEGLRIPRAPETYRWRVRAYRAWTS
jgi:hypothetical protein